MIRKHLRRWWPVIICLLALTWTSCTDKGAGNDTVFSQRPLGKRACASLDPFEEGFYSSYDVLYHVVPSDTRITVQFDTTLAHLPPERLFETHRCLLVDSGVRPLERAFYMYHLAQGWTFQTAFPDLWIDTTLNRVIPVYVLLDDETEFAVTDLIEAQFDGWHRPGGILANHSLWFVSRLPDDPNRYLVSIPGFDKGSPLACSVASHLETGVVWASPKRYLLGDGLR